MRIRSGILTIVLLALPAVLRAEPITLTATGTLDVTCGSCMQSLFGFTAGEGSPFSISLSFNTEPIIQSDVNDAVRSFVFAPGIATLMLNSHTFSIATRVFGTVRHATVLDQVEIEAESADPGVSAAGFLFSGYSQSGAFLQGLDWPQDLAAVLNSAPNRSAQVLDEFTFDLTLPVAVGSGVTFAEAPAAAPTPEPSTLILVATAVAGGAGRRWRRAFHDSANRTKEPPSVS